MRLFFLLIYASVLSFFASPLSIYAMQKDLEDCSPGQVNCSSVPKGSKANKTSKNILKPSFFEEISAGLINRIVGYLNYEEQFNFAQVNQDQLFLWASTGRIPEPDPETAITTTSDVTYLNWDDPNWPTTANKTVIIETNRDVEKKDLERFENFNNLGEILHIHFVNPERKELSVNLSPFVSNDGFPERFYYLRSLVFEGVLIRNIRLGALLSNLRNFIVQGRVVPRNWQEDSSLEEFSGFPTRNLIYFRSGLKNLCFSRSQLEKVTIKSILENLSAYRSPPSRLVEIRENNLDLDGNPVYFEEPWYEGIPFILRPWTLDEEGNARIGYEKDHFVPGPARIRHLDVRLSEGNAHVPWYKFFHFLSPAYFSVTELLPLFRAWATEDRLTALTRLIPESRIERGEALAFILPSTLQEAFATFWQAENSSQTTTSQQKEEPYQQAENTSKTYSQATSALDETIQVAASRYSAEVVRVSMRDLIDVIRENAQSHSVVQSLLDQLPTLEAARETLLGWFREALEYFSGDTADDTKEPNNAEVLVGAQLMSILRSLAAK